MSEENLYREALELALKKLKLKDRFESEIRLFLTEYPSPVVDRAISFLKERRIIDDRKTTINLVESYSGKRSIGSEKLRAELQERGAPEETIEAVFCELLSEERERMLDALTAKYSPETCSRAKAARLLYSRGFPEEEIESVLDRFFQA
jgi:SOS response regulatory protein OraA/RecX